MVVGFKYRIYPNKGQQDQLKLMFAGKRFVWNYFLTLNKERLDNKVRILTYNEMSSLLTQLKKEQIWLKQVEKSILQNTLKDLFRAFQEFFKKIRMFPKFKSVKTNHHSVRMSFNFNSAGGTIRIKEKEVQYTSTGRYKKQNCKIKLPKIKDVKIAYSRPIQGRIWSATVSIDPSGNYYVALSCTEVEPKQILDTNNKIGIDLGIKEFAICSNGDKIENPKYFRKYEGLLKKEQKKLSKRQIGSNNRNKQRIKVARLHRKIYYCRLDFLHKLSTKLINDNNIISIEDLQVSNLQKNHRMAKSIADASWYEFRRQLDYKSLWYGRKLVVIDRWFASSQLCSCCGFKNSEVKDLDLRIWKYENCGEILDRDINASINILNEGLKMLA
jgi:putative transposase